jgi:hypothetical protein
VVEPLTFKLCDHILNFLSDRNKFTRFVFAALIDSTLNVSQLRPQAAGYENPSSGQQRLPLAMAWWEPTMKNFFPTFNSHINKEPSTQVLLHHASETSSKGLDICLVRRICPLNQNFSLSCRFSG